MERRTLVEPISVNFKGGISPDKAERVIAALGQDPIPERKVVLRFTEYPYVNTGVGWRIGNALRRYSGEQLEVIVPPFLDGQGAWFRSFTRSGLGDAFAAHAGRIVAAETDITAQVRAYYAEKASRQSTNSVVWGDLHRGLAINLDREDLFRDVFLGSLKFVNVRPTHFEPDRLRDLIKLTFEAIQNVFDHAKRKPLPDTTRIVSYATLGYFKKVEENHPDPEGALKTYLARLRTVVSRVRQDFIVVCVNDDGAGIAARQAQDANIYWGSREDEVAAVRDALTAHSSVKLRAHDCRIRGGTSGEGYTYIDSCLRALRAFGLLRTGRLLGVLDGTSESLGFNLLPSELGYMPGTTLDLLIPILKEGDGLPSLFSDE